MAVVAIRTHNVTLERLPARRSYTFATFAICCCGWASEPIHSHQEFEDASRLHAKFADSPVIVLEFAG